MVTTVLARTPSVLSGPLDLTHTAQVAEVLARRYATDVGPFRQFMPALDRVAPAE